MFPTKHNYSAGEAGTLVEADVLMLFGMRSFNYSLNNSLPNRVLLLSHECALYARRADLLVHEIRVAVKFPVFGPTARDRNGHTREGNVVILYQQLVEKFRHGSFSDVPWRIRNSYIFID